MVYNHLLRCSVLDLCLLECAGPFGVCQTVLCIASIKLAELRGRSAALCGTISELRRQSHHRQGCVCTSLRLVMGRHMQLAF